MTTAAERHFLGEVGRSTFTLEEDRCNFYSHDGAIAIIRNVCVTHRVEISKIALTKAFYEIYEQHKDDSTATRNRLSHLGRFIHRSLIGAVADYAIDLHNEQYAGRRRLRHISDDERAAILESIENY